MLYPFCARVIRVALFAAALCALVLPARTARATTILGGNIPNGTVWTPAGNPYVVQGDITVPSGQSFTIQAGTIVQFAGVDGQVAGLDPVRVELTVKGTLTVAGTAANPVTFQAQFGTAAGTWYGVVVDPAATAVGLGGAQIKHAVNGLHVIGGALTFSGFSVTGSTTGVLIGPMSQSTFTNCVVSANTGDGISFQTSGFGNDVHVTGCTVHGNGGRGVSLNNVQFGVSTIHVKNSMITNNGSHGLFIMGLGGPVIDVTYSDVWGNNPNYGVVTPGVGTFSCNPIYVNAPSNLRLTSNSPARKSGDLGGDLGALPYVSDATPGFYGALWTNTVLPAGVTMAQGDIIVPAGVTLTLSPGATLQFGFVDLLDCGADSVRGELRVQGKLTSNGTPAQPVTLTGPSTGWHGLVLEASASGSSVDYTNINGASYGLTYGATATNNIIAYDTISGSTHGVYVTGGAPVLDALTIFDNTYGVSLAGNADLTLINTVVRNNTSRGIRIDATGPSSYVKVINSTVHQNGGDAIFSSAIAGSLLLTTVVNTIVTSNAGYGIVRGGLGAPTVEVTYSDVWSNIPNYGAVTPGVGCISQNPNYAGAPTNLQLTLGSVCVDSGTAVGAPNHDASNAPRPQNGDGMGGPAFDMGAYELATLTFCGDGAVQAGETCDEGMANGTYGHCKADCSGLGPRCGDGLVNGPEQCDDANLINTDACLNTCKSATCGDGFVQAVVEECDDANPSNADGCVTGCKLAKCGDGFVQTGTEQCDDGNTIDLDACSNACKSAMCGDGVIQVGEECDDGNQDNSDACLTTCKSAKCGDGVVRAGVEECDDGNLVNGDLCLNTCKSAMCGDGVVQAGAEECDDGNQDNTDACLQGCKAAKCGDGIVRAGVEGCDDGNTVDNDACSNTCKLASCGDGMVQPGEECDDGNQDNTDACLNTCLLSSCGDGFVRAGIEQCDDGNKDNADGCLADCAFAKCGDGWVRDGVEECDDGNTNKTDGCTNACKKAKCGDGVVQAGVEACDDGNTKNTDACTKTCEKATCGDGFVRAGVEACDDGNSNDGDGCLSTCETAKCGDGVVQAGVEECDDGNSDDTDGCSSTCKAARCGDGVVQVGVEECDDGNSDDGDACSATCKVEMVGSSSSSSSSGTGGGNPGQVSGCGCRAGGEDDAAPQGAILALLLVLPLVRRRKRGAP